MSSVSMNGVGQNLFQYLRSLSANGNPQTTQAGKVDTDGDADGSSGGAKKVTTGQRHHHGNPAVFQAIQKSVTDALNSASTDNTTGKDPNQVIEDAIAKVLAGQSTTTADQPAPSADTPGSTQVNADVASRQAFFQLLKDHGIDPKQFRQDFLAAIKDAQGGEVNSSTAFQSFPAGTSVDTTA